MLKLRAEEAAMLGYANYAEVSLVPKMAESTVAGGGLPARTGGQGTPLRRTRRRRTARIRAHRTGHGQAGKLGSGLGLGKTQARALRFLRRGSEAVLPRAEGDGRPVPRRSRSLFGGRNRARLGADLASGRALLSHRPRRQDWSASSTSTSMPARPSAAAPGWTTPSAGAAPTPASRRRSPTCAATSRRRSAASPPPSATTTC